MENVAEAIFMRKMKRRLESRCRRYEWRSCWSVLNWERACFSAPTKGLPRSGTGHVLEMMAWENEMRRLHCPCKPFWLKCSFCGDRLIHGTESPREAMAWVLFLCYFGRGVFQNVSCCLRNLFRWHMERRCLEVGGMTC